MADSDPIIDQLWRLAWSLASATMFPNIMTGASDTGDCAETSPASGEEGEIGEVAASTSEGEEGDVLQAHRRLALIQLHIAAHYTVATASVAEGYLWDPRPGLSRHRHLLRFLRAHDAKTLRQAAALLASLHSLRHLAEFHPDRPLGAADIVEAVSMAQTLLETIGGQEQGS